MYCHLHHSLILKAGQKTTHSILRFIPLPKQIWDGLHIYHVLVLPGYKQKMDPLVRISSGLKFGCHGWVHWLSSPRSLLTWTEGQTITHFCRHSFHGQSPAWPADEALLESVSLLTQQCGASPSDEHFQSVECEILIGNIQPEEIVGGRGAGGVLETHMRKFNFCISEDLSKRLMQEAESLQASP